MLQLFQIFGYVLLAWLAALALIIAYRILRGDISLQGILTTADGSVDPERVQTLLVSFFVLGTLIIEAPSSASRGSLPNVPESLLVLLAGSNSLYLGGKIARTQHATTQRARRRPRERRARAPSTPRTPG
jgi:hypothetical protein